MVRISRLLQSFGILSVVAAVGAVNCDASAQSVLRVDINAGPGGDGSSWANAFDSIEDAFAVAGNGDSIWVAKGTYVPSIRTEPNTPRTESFVLPTIFSINGIQLLGGFDGTEQLESERDPELNVTILSGDIDGDDDYDAFVNDARTGGNFGNANISDNAYHVVTALDVDANTRIDGFTIVGGNADGPDAHKRGGGMYCGQFDSPTFGTPRIRACTFKYNRTGVLSGAAGAAINASHGTIQIRNCTFNQNVGTAVVKISRLDGFFASTLNLVGCVFDVHAGGGAVIHEPGFAGEDGSPMTTNIMDCTFATDGDNASLTADRIKAMSQCGPWQR